jgi:cyclic dehypoxanthinyl futalosine synthase
VRLAFGLDATARECEIERVEAVLRRVRLRFPAIWLEGLSAAEVMAVARSCGLGLPQTIARLRDAGLDSIAGDAMGVGGSGADGIGVQEWAEVQRAAHGAGMRTVATMAFGAGGFAERVDLLEAVRRVQEETGGFAAFVPLCLAAGGAAASRDPESPTAVEHLKTLAIARMFLDNVENVQSSGATQGLKVLQMGLRFGANDAGPVTPEVARAGGRPSSASESEEELRRVIRDAGFRPVQRDMVYRTLFLN